MLRYRGKNAAAHYLRRRRADGRLHVVVTDIPNCSLLAVEAYKDLGGMITMRGDPVADAKVKHDSAMNAYVPLDVKIFGDENVSDFLKFNFSRTLVHSRLDFDAHIKCRRASVSRY